MSSSSVPQATEITTHTRPASSRLFSLDVFRGATIAAMILVNNPGSDFAYAPLNHSKWNGWTPTDLIFPFFLFIVGVSLTLSFRSRLLKGETRRNLLIHSIRRSAIIFLIGIFLNGFPHFHLATWRVAGVLQRIAIAYLVATVIALYTKSRGIAIWVAGLLIGYWVAMRFIPIPGLGMPVRDVPLLAPDGNLSWYFDKLYLPGRMYEKTRDPEGYLSTLPAIATALLGVLTGDWLNRNLDAARKVAGMLAFGVAGIVAGEIWNVWFPINKKLWTSSFVLFTAGCALVALALCYWVCDVKLRRGTWTKPFIVFGTNAIAAYVLAEIVAILLINIHVHMGPRIVTLQEFLFRTLLGPISPRELGSLVWAVLFVCLCWLAIYAMYRKRIFLKV